MTNVDYLCLEGFRMAGNNIERQKALITEFREAYKGTEYAKLSDIEILSILNEQLNNVSLSGDEQVSLFLGTSQGNIADGIQVNNPLTKEETSQLKQKLKERVGNISSKIDEAEKNNGWMGKAWSWTKNTLGFGASSNKVKEQKKKEEELLSKGDLKNSFKELTGVDYSPENVRKFLNGEIKLLSEQALDSYIEGQDMAKDIIGDIGSGIVAMAGYSLALGAVAATGGAAIPIALGVAVLVGGGAKVALKSSDGTNKESKLHDFITGGFSGVLAPFTGGMGGAVGKSIATKMGMQVVKQGTAN
jgi:hypothetical protein